MDDLHIGFLVPVEVEAFGEDEDGVDLSLAIKVWDTLFYLPGSLMQEHLGFTQ